jgi:hypothetical protein
MRQMKPSPLYLVLIVSFLVIAPAWGAESLAGRWLLNSQEVGGQKTDPDPLTLRVTPNGNGFDFAYSVPVNDVQFVSMSFNSRLDGIEAEVKDSRGNKMGSIKITRAGTSQYSVVLQGANRPTANGKMTVSGDGKTLTVETDAQASGKAAVHTIQVFARQ